MKLKRYEIATLIITLVLVAVTVIYFISGSFEEEKVSISFSQKVPVPTSPVTDTGNSENVDKININSANLVELCKLPYIGEVLGQRIIDYRNEHGQFAYTSDIIDVSGIGFSTYEKIKHLIAV